MARRMFSDEITVSDAFLDMPTESQLLYFHLGMNADDDGFISNVKTVQRIIGAGEDALKLLLVKKFLLKFENGILVVKHWRVNNQIRKDRYNETKYIKEKAQLFIRENGAYSFNPDNAIPVPRGHFLPPVNIIGNQSATNGCLSIGKVSIGKVSIEYDSFSSFWDSYPRKEGKKNAEKSWNKIDPLLHGKILFALKEHCKSEQWIKDDGKFIPHPATWLNQERWNDEIKNLNNAPIKI